MAPPFEEAAFSQKVGETGPVVETQFGYHVIEVTDAKEAGVQPFEGVADAIRENLDNQARQEVFGAYIATLREGAKISYGAVAAAVE